MSEQMPDRVSEHTSDNMQDWMSVGRDQSKNVFLNGESSPGSPWSNKQLVLPLWNVFKCFFCLKISSMMFHRKGKFWVNPPCLDDTSIIHGFNPQFDDLIPWWHHLYTSWYCHGIPFTSTKNPSNNKNTNTNQNLFCQNLVINLWSISKTPQPPGLWFPLQSRVKGAGGDAPMEEQRNVQRFSVAMGWSPSSGDTPKNGGKW
jgi:hypothetical protein